MFDGGSDDRESKRDVYAAPDPEHLSGNVALVVIHGDTGVKLALHGAVENRVASEGAVYINAEDAGMLDGGTDKCLFLVTKEAVLTSVRVQSCDSKARLVNAGRDRRP